MTKQQGFTLIELLVVVLIIGILAAVALPQYKKAVLKTHYTHIKAMTLAYVKAAEVYYLANNVWPTEFSQMDVDVPFGSKMQNPTSNNCETSGNIYCCLSTGKAGYQSAGVTCGKTDYIIGYSYDFGRNPYCMAKDTDNTAISICAEEGGRKIGTNLATPTGHKTGYITYIK